MAKEKPSAAPLDPGVQDKCSIAEIERAAFKVLFALQSLLQSTQRVVEHGGPAGGTAGQGQVGRGKTAITAKPCPAHWLLARIVAFRTSPEHSDLASREMGWLEEVIQQARAAPLILSWRRFASGFRALRYISEGTIFLPEDDCRVDPVLEQVGAAYRSVFQTSVGSNTPGSEAKGAYSAIAPRGFYDLETVLAFAFSGHNLPAECATSPLDQKLATTLRDNPGLREGVSQVRVDTLAARLSELADQEELSIIGEELIWEFSKARGYLGLTAVKGLEASANSVTEQNGRSRLGADLSKKARRNPRGKFAYDLLRKSIPQKTALTRFKRMAEERCWRKVSSVQGRMSPRTGASREAGGG